MKKFFRIFLLSVCLAVTVAGACAQETKAAKKTRVDSIPLTGYIYDRLTSRELPSTFVQVLRPDSSVISTAKGGSTFWKYDKGNYYQDSTSKYEIFLPRRQGDYIIKVSKSGYTDLYAPYRAEFGSRTNELRAPKIYLSREVVRELQEVTVRASKIKVYHKGDTLVYDAAAFSLPEGSMLDALVKQMPGVEIKENKIYVNGRFVESLLLNGKEFFKGDQSVVMHNIGAYSVKNVAVYEKNEESAALLGDRDDIQKDYVMDVRLKKDYMAGTALNADAGYGTRGRYLGRLFAMRYTNNSRLSLYGNTNNMNISERLTENGELDNDKWDAGITTRANAGIDYNVDNALHTWELSGNADVHYTDVVDRTNTNTVQYLQTTDNFLFSDLSSRLNRLQVSTDHELKLNRDSWNLRINPSFKYNKTNSHSDTYSATFDKEFDGMNREVIENLYKNEYINYTTEIINRNIEHYNRDEHGYNGEVAASSKIKIPNSPDAIELKGNVRYKRNTQWGNTLQDICFGDLDGQGLSPATSLLQKRDQTIAPNYTFRLLGLARYYFTLPFGSLNASYEYIHTQDRKNAGLMVMESMAQGNMAEFQPGQPWLSDLNNSYAGKTYKNQHHVKLMWRLKKKYEKVTFEAGLEPSVYLERHDLYYSQGDAYVDPSKTFLRVKVENVFVRWVAKQFRMGLVYDFYQDAPDLLKMVDIPNTTDPMNIWLGNPDLKKSSTHSFNFNVYHKAGRHTTQNLYMWFTLRQNSFANGYRYDSATGVKELKTYNVNGSNNLNVYHWINQDLDKSGEWVINNNIGFGVNNSANMIGYDSEPVRQKVRNWRFHENLDISMEKKNVTLGVSGGVSWNKTVYADPNPTQNTYGTYRGGFYGDVKLPYNFSVNTRIGFNKYFGYIDNTMNRTVWIWNAEVSYSMLKGALRFSINGADLFNQRKGLYMSSNATGRSQVDELTLGRVILFKVAYKINIKPKRGKK